VPQRWTLSPPSRWPWLTSSAIFAILLILIAPGPIGQQTTDAIAPLAGVPHEALLGNSTGSNSSQSSSLNSTFDSPALPAAPTLPLSGNWPTYGQNDQRTDAALGERTISPTNVSTLAPVWSAPYKSKAVIEGSLAAVNGTLYFGDYHGNITALNAVTGAPRWSVQPGGSSSNHSYTDCFTPAQSNVRGITSTPTIWNNTVYIADGNGSLVALNATTGNLLWNVSLTTQTHDPWTWFYIWGSPLLYDGFAYIGTASGCDSNPVQGEVKQINLVQNRTYPTIAVRHVFTVVMNNSTVADAGGSVWSTPSVDPTTGSIYITTGNRNKTTLPAVPGTNWNWTQAVVRLVQSNFCSPTTQQGCSTSGYYNLSGSGTADVDFGAGATVFHDDHGTTMVGALNKNGSFYAFYASNLTPSGSGKPDWNVKIATSGAPAGKNIAPAAFDGSNLYVAGYSTTLPGPTNCAYGAIRSLNATNGSLNWGACLPGFVHAGVTYANGVVYVAALWQNATGGWNSTLDGFSAPSGTLLYTHVLNGTIDGEPVVADGRVYVTVGNFHTLCGNGTAASPCAPGYVYAFGLPLGGSNSTAVPYVILGPDLVVYPFGNATGGMPSYNYSWAWGDGHTSYGRYPGWHLYANGRFVLVLTITDAAGDTSQSAWEVYQNYYSCGGSTLKFCYTGGVIPCITVGSCFLASYHPYPITFAAAVANGVGGLSWNWNFGDGSSPSTAARPTHTYSTHGTYTITVTATDQNHHQAIQQFQVTV
jgi:polyvinyl alcohol dehydrogenase (cytochrome)